MNESEVDSSPYFLGYAIFPVFEVIELLFLSLFYCISISSCSFPSFTVSTGWESELCLCLIFLLMNQVVERKDWPQELMRLNYWPWTSTTRFHNFISCPSAFFDSLSSITSQDSLCILRFLLDSKGNSWTCRFHSFAPSPIHCRSYNSIADPLLYSRAAERKSFVSSIGVKH